MRRAFALADVLVVISIVALVAALSNPAFISVRRSAQRSQCMSNLHQWGAAISIYREDLSGSDTGTPIQMGLPVDLNPKLVSMAKLECRGNNPKGNGYYFNYPFPDMSEARQHEWASYTSSVGSSAVILYDPNHQASFPRSITWDTWTALGLRLDGSVVVRTRRGFPLYLRWWHD